MVSFMVARADDPERWPFLQYSVVVRADSNGTSSAVLPSLHPKSSYLVMARAHARGQTTGWYMAWSDVAHHSSVCSTGAQMPGGVQSGFAGPARRGATGRTQTRWLEMFRHNGNNWWRPTDPTNNVTLPDYLASHNTADLNGAFDNIYTSVYKLDELNSSFTRYCVEIEDVELSNVTTVTDRTDLPELGGYPVNSSFADYVACASGYCFCMDYGDRMGRQPKKTLEALCPKCYPNGLPTCLCQCPEQSVEQSLKHVGMIPTRTHAASSRVVIDGRWFSLPSGGMCAVGASIGEDGCTWQVAPLSHSISLATSFSKGIFQEGSLNSSNWTSGKGYPDVARRVFGELGARECGAARPAEDPLVV